jgi:hypothetical protein
MTAVILL